MIYRKCNQALAAAGYLTDPIGKCLRTQGIVETGKKPRSDLAVQKSETWSHLQQHGDAKGLASQFDPERADEFFLVWLAGARSRDPEPSISLPIEEEAKAWEENDRGWRLAGQLRVLVDRNSGVLLEPDTGRYALFVDVEFCAFRKSREQLVR